MSRWARVFGAALLLAPCFMPRIAAAQTADETTAAAQALFDEGRALRQQARFEEAIAKFTASQRLAPAVGTLINIGDCYRALGKSASAWVNYVEAATSAEGQGDAERQQHARAQADALEPVLARLRIEVLVPDVAGLVVRRDEAEVPAGQWGSVVPVDPGEHHIEALAPGHERWTTQVVGSSGSLVQVVVPELAPLPEPPLVRPIVAPPRTAVPTGEGNEGTRAAAWTLVAGGAAAVAAGIGLGVGAASLDDESDEYCPESPDVCLPRGAELREDARDLEVAAIASGSAGAVMLLAGGAMLLFGGEAPRAAGSGWAWRW